MNTVTISVKFFGGFRKFGDSIDVTVPSGSTVATIKNSLYDELNGENLVLSSVLANSDAVLQDNIMINDDVELSILPPVCGG